MKKYLCPRCEQDYIVKANIIPLQKNILICPECEAFWDINTSPNIQSFDNYVVYMEENSLSGLWEYLEILGILEVNSTFVPST